MDFCQASQRGTLAWQSGDFAGSVLLEETLLRGRRFIFLATARSPRAAAPDLGHGGRRHFVKFNMKAGSHLFLEAQFTHVIKTHISQPSVPWQGEEMVSGSRVLLLNRNPSSREKRGGTVKGNGLKTLFGGLGGGRGGGGAEGGAEGGAGLLRPCFLLGFRPSTLSPSALHAFLRSVPSLSVSFRDPFVFSSLTVYFSEA